ncbi:MAG: hypothetical protein JSS66_15620 [Armatimonadetes bacterium]|nr:hypothetical protein [Armatimonadota bacterium]
MYTGVLILVATSVVAFALMTLLVWRRRNHSAEILLAALPLVVILVLAHLRVEQGAERVRNELRDSLRSFAPTFAASAERMGHADLKTGDNDSLAYWRFIAAETRWMREYPVASAIYTVRQDGKGGFVFVTSAACDYDGNGTIQGEREERVPSGDEYEEKPPEFADAFTKGEGFSPSPAKDKWGVWVTATHVLRDSQGKPEAALCVDFPASDWAAAQDRERFRATEVGLFVVSLYMVVATLVLRMTADRREAEQSSLAMERLLAHSDSVMESAEGLVAPGAEDDSAA